MAAGRPSAKSNHLRYLRFRQLPGDIHEGSDLDLIIVKDTQERFTGRIGAVMRACDFDTPVEPLVYTQAELDRMVDRGNDFILTALGEGKVVYEKQ